MRRTMRMTRRHCASLLLAVLAAGALAQGATAERPLVFGVNRVGGFEVLHNPPGYREDLYRTIRAAGGTCVRLIASPRDIEPVRGARDWNDFERDLALAIKYEQEPIVCIVNTPAWASPTGEATHLYPYRGGLLGEFASFCEDLAARTRGKVRLFQLWNEPNGCGWHFEDGFNHADEYLPVLAACRAGLAKGNPDARLALGGMDDAEGHAPIFITKLYEEAKRRALDVRTLFDAASDHPYSETSALMRAKLDALRAILDANGNAAAPFWITEYGWHTGGTAPEEQARRLAATLAAFASDPWKDLQAAVYLCIADFEMTEDGFGLTDANLRPRPAFHAFQGASRFGAYPPFRIEAAFLQADTLRVAWQTLAKTRGSVRLEALGGAAGTAGIAVKDSPEGTTHATVFEKLVPERVYRYRIETVAAAGGRSILSAPYEIRAPGPRVWNGGFEEGFTGGIGKGWRIEGRGFCTDAMLLPKGTAVDGSRAQAVFAEGVHGHRNFESTLSTIVAATPGRELRVSYAWAALEQKTLTEIKARAGLDPTGRADPSKVVWSDWQEVGAKWKTNTARLAPEGSLAAFVVQCKLEGELKKGSAAFLLDAVRVEP